MRRGLVKVVATLGPATKDPGVVRHMLGLGVAGFRVNFSHGGPSDWDELVGVAREAEAAAGVRAALMGDLEGPRVRTANREPVRLEKGAIVTLGFQQGDVPIDSREFFEVLEEGDTVLADDGKIVLQVESVEGLLAKARVVEGGVLGPRKGVVISGKEPDMPMVTQRDKESIRYAASRGFSHVLVSYTRGPEHVELVRSLLRRAGAERVRVLAKIETPRGVERAREIAEASDGVVVARGDLGMHYSLDDLPMIVKGIVEAARSEYKPVVIATEFLQSMIERPIPTRSEIVDIYEAVHMGVDGLMLTNETAVGRYPARAVYWMVRASSKALSYLYSSGWRPAVPEARGSLYKLARGLVEMVESLGATLVVYSKSGRLASRIAAFRPSRPFYVGVPCEAVERGVRHLWGAEPVVVGDHSYEEGLRATVSALVKQGYLGEDDLVVEAAWSSEENVYIARVRNLIV